MQFLTFGLCYKAKIFCLEIIPKNDDADRFQIFPLKPYTYPKHQAHI